MTKLDLIITVDTSIAHLAGSMGCKVWVVLQYIPDWRWMLDKKFTPWYPSMKLFRQSKLNEENFQTLFINESFSPWVLVYAKP